jgi:hypothetical protein
MSSQQLVDFIHEQLQVVCGFGPLVTFDEHGFEIFGFSFLFISPFMSF